MKRKKSNLFRFVFIVSLLVVMAVVNYRCQDQKAISDEKFSEIQQGFIEPRDTNTIWCYYYWIGDDISMEGVSKDLEAMKEFGIGACLIGNINPDEVDGPVPLFSEEWWDIMVHVVKEGDRLGIDIGFFNCPGWSQSGGPWVTYDKAMRHMVYTEKKVKGGERLKINLEKPAEEFQDEYVLAFKTISDESRYLSSSNASVRVRPSIQNEKLLLDKDINTAALFDVKRNKEYKIEIIAKEAITARSLVIYPAKSHIKTSLEVLAEVNGEQVSIASFLFDRSNSNVNVGPVTHGPVAISLPDTRSDKFIIKSTDLSSDESMAGFSEIRISEAQVMERYVEKTLGKMHPTPFPAFDSYLWDMQESVENENLIVSEIVDISDKMDKEGNLKWDAPEGDWTVLRMGMTPTGTENSPAAPQGKGYEIDKASAQLAAFHFENYIGEILKRIPEENRDAFKYVIADSYEMGSQNWTDGFAEKFEDRYGYSPVKFLPVFSGRIVESVDASERFLWDLRRMVADDVAYEYVGGLRKISNEHNLLTWLENYGHWGYPGEFLMYGGQSNLVSGEYWNEGHLGDIECKSASSAAHLYGKPITSAEAFTAGQKAYQRHPALLKKRGDWSYTEGINHFVLHLYIHQPDDVRIPGINAWFSTEFNRHNTWFDQGKNWTDYLRRNQHMLQQGKYVADVLYYIGEDAPKMTGEQNPELPAGYSYDYINAEVIKDRIAVEDGKYVLPDGMKYSLLVLPEIETMRPEVLGKLESLISQGGAVLGTKPLRSPSLENYPECDQEVKELANTIWGEDYQSGELIREYGEGYIMNDISIQQALDKLEIGRDVDFDENVPVLWTHRHLPGMEIYFMTNQSEQEVSFSPSFRVSDMQPQLWDAVSGEIRNLNIFTDNGERTSLLVKLNALQSCYIVFTEEHNDRASEGYAENFPDFAALKQIETAWTVDYLNKEFGPEKTITIEELGDWTLSENDKVKYYSGTAVYKTSFEMESLPGKGEIFINLGSVGVMAEVKLNGTDLGCTWIAPFRLNAKDALKEGANELEVEVVNVWRNRMTGDLNLPEDQRYTWTVVSDAEKGGELTPSGLLGPVTVELIK